MSLLLSRKTAVIYGAGGAIGGAVARAFAQEGASVFLTGRNLSSVAAVAEEISAAGGVAEAAQVDALDEKGVEKHLNGTVQRTGGIDITFNAAGISGADVRDKHLQGMPLAMLPLESFSLPIAIYTRLHFLTARAAARRMVKKQSGVILMHTPEPARAWAPRLWEEWLRPGPRWKLFREGSPRSWDRKVYALSV
jgi:NAD(P)-dependent dehydrogenase (short-subunit alcohol dehydrogenase family)